MEPKKRKAFLQLFYPRSSLMSFLTKIQKSLQTSIKKAFKIFTTRPALCAALALFFIILFMVLSSIFVFFSHQSQAHALEKELLELTNLEKRFLNVQKKYKENERLWKKHQNSQEHAFDKILTLNPLEEDRAFLESQLQNPHLPKTETLKRRLLDSKKPLSLNEEALPNIETIKESLISTQEKILINASCLEQFLRFIETSEQQAPQTFFKKVKIERVASGLKKNKVLLSAQVIKRSYP